jgi:hypothetical protein
MLCSSLYATSSSSGGDAELNVFITFVNTRTHKKKIALVIRGCRRNEEVRHIILHDAHKLNDNGYIISYVAQTKHILMLYNVVKGVPYFVLIKDYAFYFLILWRLQYKAIQA